MNKSTPLPPRPTRTLTLVGHTDFTITPIESPTMQYRKGMMIIQFIGWLVGWYWLTAMPYVKGDSKGGGQ